MLEQRYKVDDEHSWQILRIQWQWAKVSFFVITGGSELLTPTISKGSSPIWAKETLERIQEARPSYSKLVISTESFGARQTIFQILAPSLMSYVTLVITSVFLSTK